MIGLTGDFVSQGWERERPVLIFVFLGILCVLCFIVCVTSVSRGLVDDYRRT